MIDVKNIISKVKSKFTNENRLIHTLNVAKKTQELIIQHDLEVNLQKAYVAGLLHDYAKEETFEGFREIVQKYNLDESILQQPFSILHALFGPYIIKEELDFEDEEIFQAITYHPIGHSNMSLLDEVLFLADFISDDRTYDICIEVREIAKKNFSKAVAKKLEYLVTNIPNPHQETIKAYEKYKQYL